MGEERAKRKLAAIFSADVKGYSRLMADDEESTVRTINAYRKVMTDLIQRHDGRVVDAKGDNVLAEFRSVVDAVRCSSEVQKELRDRNADLPEHRQMAFRIGVNLGDVIVEEETIYGDGVNVAARLEGLADAGGICISGTAYDHIKRKLNLGYEYLGKQTVKNIPESVRVYKVLTEPAYAGQVFDEKRRKPKQRRWAAVAIALVIVAGAWVIWNFYFRGPPIEPASVKKIVYPLPDKPSIAVLPFVNMSEDPKQEYFSDGISEEIITALSKIPKLFVIARHSSFTYKGKSISIPTVGRELGVRHVLEGSVRKAGNKIRITAQLIDAKTDKHLWAERYDRDLKDIFAIQDEITMKVVNALQVKLTEGEHGRTFAKGTENLEAYLLVLQAVYQSMRMTKDANALSRQLAEKAIALDSKYAAAYRVLANTYWLEFPLGVVKNPRQSIAMAMEFAEKSLALDKSSGMTHTLLGWLHTIMRQHEKGICFLHGLLIGPASSSWL